MSYHLCSVPPKDEKLNQLVNHLLEQEGIQRDQNLDYTCALLDEEGLPVATGSCFGNTLRCFAVDSRHQGEGLLNQMVLHLITYQLERGNTHLFLYTKLQSEAFFLDLGFHEIARAADQVVFLENRKNGFTQFLKKLKRESPAPHPGEIIGSVVLNANPFTLGHQYLLEQAAKHCDLVHVFLVSEDASIVPFSVRKPLVERGTAHLKNLVFHETGSYLISSQTFPSYFLKEESAVCEGHARLDAAIFAQIAKTLHISCRFVGEEPASVVTGIYNRVMAEQLPAEDIDCIILPRKFAGDHVISASTVRKMIQDGKLEETKPFLPQSTWDYFHSEQAQPVILAMRNAQNVIHY